MRKALAAPLVCIGLVAHADRIYIINSPGYNSAQPHFIAALTALGHTVVENSTTFTLPPGFTSTCVDPVNGYDWLCLFGNNDFTVLTAGVEAFITSGGKVWYQYEVSCCTVSSSSVASMLSSLTGLTITPNSNPYIALDFTAQGGWTATGLSCCVDIVGNAYKGLDGLPPANQWMATSELNGATPPISTCPNYGFVFTTTDFVAPGSKGAICGVGDVNFWFDGKEPANPVNPAVVEYFFPNQNSTCYLFAPGCNVSPIGPPNVSLGNDTTLCPGETLVLNASTSSATYLWQDNSTASSYTVTQAGTYWVEVTSPCGVSRDTIVVNYSTSPNVNLGADTNLCDGATIVLDATTTGATYLWQDNSTDPTFSVTQAGSYWVEVDNGCTARDTIDVAYSPVPIFALRNDTAICKGDVLLLDATTPGASYLWHDNSTAATYASTAGTTATVDVTIGPCTASDTVLVADALCECPVAIANAFSPNDDQRNDHFAPILVCPPTEYLFRIYSRWGEVVFETTDPLVAWDGTQDGKIMPLGAYVYLVNITFAGDAEPRILAGSVTLLR